MSITRISEFQAKPGNTEEVRTLLNSVIQIVQSTIGCESARLLQSQDDAARFVVIEIWSTVDAHKAAAKNIPPEKFRTAMQLLVSPPIGAYYNESPVR